jgi:hypothetical protein
MMKRSESPGKKDVKMKAVSRNKMMVTAKTAKPPKLAIID